MLWSLNNEIDIIHLKVLALHPKCTLTLSFAIKKFAVIFYLRRLHGSYQAIEGGFLQDALVDMTGGIGEAYFIQDFARNPEFLYNTVMRSFKMNSLICCGTGVNTWKYLNKNIKCINIMNDS